MTVPLIYGAQLVLTVLWLWFRPARFNAAALRASFDEGYALGLEHGQLRTAEDDVASRIKFGQAFARRAVLHPQKWEQH